MKKITFALGILLLLTTACNSNKSSSIPSNTSSQTPQQPQTYDNKFMFISVLPGWTAATAKDKQSVNITNGNYILYINPLFGHASGVVGGRFNEVADGMPSVDLVMAKVEPPATGDECAQVVRTRITDTLALNNYYTDSSKRGNHCLFPSDGKPAWFGATASGTAEQVFGRTQYPPPFNDFAITVAYKTKDVNQLPKQGDQDLQQKLADATAMLKTLQLKQLTGSVGAGGSGSFVVISQWGVKFAKPAGMDDLQYAQFGSDANTMTFDTSQLMAADRAAGGRYCTADQAPIGVLSRSAGAQEGSSGRPIPTNLKIGAYYYYYTHPQAPCTDNRLVQQLEDQQISALKGSIETTLQAAQ